MMFSLGSSLLVYADEVHVYPARTHTHAYTQASGNEQAKVLSEQIAELQKQNAMIQGDLASARSELQQRDEQWLAEQAKAAQACVRARARVCVCARSYVRACICPSTNAHRRLCVPA